MTIEDFNNIEYAFIKSTSGIMNDLYCTSDFIEQMKEEYECSFEEIPEVDIYKNLEEYLKNECSDILDDEEIEISLI